MFSSAPCSPGTELDDVLGVETKHALLKLCRAQKLAREKVDGLHLYMSVESGKRREQRALRESRDAAAELGAGIETEVMPEELKAAIILFFSLLDEQQRRLYAGLEAAKLGHGGDRKLADLLGLDPHTVAKGRQQLFTGDVRRDQLRGDGGGDIPIEKKAARNRGNPRHSRYRSANWRCPTASTIFSAMPGCWSRASLQTRRNSP